MRESMFYGAGAIILQRAKKLRNRLTDAEMILWCYLRCKPNGYKFRRQHPIRNYIVDFYCHRLRLVIEVDGSIHDREDIRKYDRERQNKLVSEGITVIRFTNEEIIKDWENSIKEINAFLNA